MLLNLSAFQVVGQEFRLRETNVFYHIHSVEASSNGIQVSIQYEGDRYELTSSVVILLIAYTISTCDCVTSEELGSMLQNSDMRV